MKKNLFQTKNFVQTPCPDSVAEKVFSRIDVHKRTHKKLERSRVGRYLAVTAMSLAVMLGLRLGLQPSQPTIPEDGEVETLLSYIEYEETMQELEVDMAEVEEEVVSTLADPTTEVTTEELSADDYTEIDESIAEINQFIAFLDDDTQRAVN